MTCSLLELFTFLIIFEALALLVILAFVFLKK